MHAASLALLALTLAVLDADAAGAAKRTPCGDTAWVVRVTGACVTPAHPPFCAYTHLHDATGAGIGIDGDGPYPDPEATMDEPCGYGPVVTVPGCGPDTVPPC